MASQAADESDEPTVAEMEDDEDAAWAEDIYGPNDFSRMVAEVGAYADVLLRNEIDEIQRIFTTEDEEEAHWSLASRSGNRAAAFKKEWRRPIAIDWVLVESIVIVFHVNIRKSIGDTNCGVQIL